MSDQNPLAIEATNLRRTFDDFVAVDDIELAISRGEIYGFLGPNGAGKSTTVKMLCTLLLPTSGTAIVAGHNVATEPDEVRLRIGVALQEAALDDMQTGEEILRQQARYYGLTKAETDQRLADLSTLIDLGDALQNRVKSYSGGMKRRLDLAAALIHNPEVLFLDEPTTGLDPVSRAKVWDEVRRLNTDLGMTIFLTTQYLEEADELADRLGIIDGGVIVAEGTPTELKRQIGSDLVIVRADDVTRARAVIAGVPGIDKVEVSQGDLYASTTSGEELISPIAVALAAEGIVVRAISVRQPTLDDVFLTLTGHHLQNEEQQP